MRTASVLRAGLIVLLGFCTSTPSPAQADDDGAARTLFEHLIDPENETDLETMLDEIDALLDRPLCLETARFDDIAAMPFLDDAAAGAVYAALQENPPTWQAIETALEHEAARYALLRACAVLHCEEKPSAGRFSLRSRFQQEDRPRRGFLDGSYPGSRARLLQRLRIGIGSHLSAALLVEKDPGERLLTDHYAGYVSVDDIGVLRRLVLGDVSVTAGQGLVFWQSFAMGKSSQATSVMRSSALLRPSASSTEGGGPRGLGLQLDLDPIDLVLLLSSAARDASIDEEEGTAGSFSVDGLHRTESEAQRAGRVQEQLAGLHLRCRDAGAGLQAGMSMLAARYSLSSRSRSPFAFEGDRAWTGGLDLRWGREKYVLYAEGAYAHTHAGALLMGAELRPSEHARISLLYRRYAARFVNLQGSGFGERSGSTQNEEGLYCGLRLLPARGLRIELWADLFRYPNRTTLLDLPASGSEMLLAAAYRPLPRTELGLRLRRERKDKSVPVQDALGRDLRSLTTRSRTGVRWDLAYESRSGLRMRLRADYAHVAHDRWLPAAQGYLLGADIRWRPSPAVTLVASFCAYHSDNWDARLYRFEQDVRGVMRSSACDGEGVRSYFLAVANISEHLALSGRYALTVHEGEREIGTGRDAVEGDRLGTISLQMDWNY